MNLKLCLFSNRILLVALGLSLIAFALFSCRSPKEVPPLSTEVVILWDVSEPHDPTPSADEILRLLALDSDPSRGAILRFRYMNNVSLNPETVFVLPASEQGLLTNTFDREREILAFQDSVRAFILSLHSQATGTEQSSLYNPITDALSDLVNSPAQRKVLLLFSDLRENTSTITFYSQRILTKMQTDSSTIEDLLTAESPLPELGENEIEVMILYQPRDPVDDASFKIVSHFYQSLLQKKGAVVTIAASLVP